jgi:hypothetical protein
MPPKAIFLNRRLFLLEVEGFGKSQIRNIPDRILCDVSGRIKLGNAVRIVRWLAGVCGGKVGN